MCERPELKRPDSKVFGIGVGCDLSFDKDMIQRYGSKVWAFDPTPGAIGCVQKMLPSLPSSLFFVPLGIGAVDDDAVDVHLPKTHGESFTPTQYNTPIKQKASIKVRTLQSLLRLQGFQSVDVLKIDVESFEFSIVKSWKEAQQPPCARQLLIELHNRFLPADQGRQAAKELLSTLEDFGFALFHVEKGEEYSLICVRGPCLKQCFNNVLEDE